MEVLRQPLEDGTVTISRVNGNYTYPLHRYVCRCYESMSMRAILGIPVTLALASASMVNKYLSRVSGPLIGQD